MADKTSRTLRSEPSTVLALKSASASRLPNARWEESVATVSVHGDLDREALWAIDYTIGRAAADAGRIVLDLREVTHLDYNGVPELVARRKELLARGGDLLIAVRNPYVSNILKAAGGAELILFRSAEEAAGAVASASAKVRMLRR
jgi:anti-anti-sigma factor